MNLIDELYTDDPTSGQRKLRAAVRPKPFLSAPGEMNRKFPYLTAVIDRYSRRILSWRLSTTLSADFCEEAFREAIDRYGWPEIFNTDQGSQYTSRQFTGIFDREGCPTRLSMDGRGRAYDNIFVERFWRTLKQEDIYIRGYESVPECRRGIAAFMKRYNDVREHSSLDWNSPSDVYFGRVNAGRGRIDEKSTRESKFSVEKG